MEPVIHAMSNVWLPAWDAPAGNHGGCIQYLGLNVCFRDFNFHDFMQARFIEAIGQSEYFLLGILFSRLSAISGHRIIILYSAVSLH